MSFLPYTLHQRLFGLTSQGEYGGRLARREVHPRMSQNMKDRSARVWGVDHGQAR